MVVVIWQPNALDDIEKISEYIARDSERYASIFVQQLFKEAETLETQPYAGRMVPETADEFIRELIIGSYRLIYKIVSEKQVDILTVHHGARLLYKF